MPKGRDSGMPPQAQWESYFDPAGILTVMGCGPSGDVVEFGCGFGTFTLAAARRVDGTVYALDVDPSMVRTTAIRTQDAKLENVVVEQRDFVETGCGRPDGSASYVMLFNLLHIEEPDGVAAGSASRTSRRKPRGRDPLEIRGGHASWAAARHSSDARAVPAMGRRGGIPLVRLSGIAGNAMALGPGTSAAIMRR